MATPRLPQGPRDVESRIPRDLDSQAVEAMRRLIFDVGPKKAANRVGLSADTIYAWASGERRSPLGRLIVLVLLALEEGQESAIAPARLLAQVVGRALTELPEEADLGALEHRLLEVSRQLGAVDAEYLRSLEDDGLIDLEERRRLAELADELVAAALRLRKNLFPSPGVGIGDVTKFQGGRDRE